MELFEAIEKRRSVRKFKTQKFEDEKIKKAIEAAVLAPNSSNTQTWDFFWPRDPEIKQKAVEICLSQSAAKSASDLIVVTADPKKWTRSQPEIISYLDQIKAPQGVYTYYQKLVPLMYKWGVFNALGVLKWISIEAAGLFRTVPRGPYFRRDSQEVAIKSAALAAENFVLAITGLGGATCMMEGFDETRMKRLLKLPSSARVVMVIAVGYAADDGIWGPRFRISTEKVLHMV